MDGGETALDIVKWTVNKSFARKCRIQVPVCEVHIAAWKRREQASFFFKVSAVFAFPLIFGLTMFNTSVVTRQPWIWTAAVGAVGMAVFLGLAVRRNGGFAWPADFRMKSLTDAEIHFVDVSPTFVAAMNPADDDRDSDESSMP